MIRRTKERLYTLLLAITALFVLWFVLSRLRIIVVTFLPWWMLAILLLAAAVVLFLAVDQLMDRN
jgi:type VI protein secretion system component VasF